MRTSHVECCLADLKNKKCKSFDRMPVCALFDARVTLLGPLSSIFEKIYTQGTVPDQWKVSKIFLIFKTGSRIEIENFRPNANLCVASTIFEKRLVFKNYNVIMIRPNKQFNRCFFPLENVKIRFN